MIGRVHGRASFERIAREGTRVRSGPLWCSMVADSSVVPARVAFAVGRAVGPAVVRNRVRRRLREILRAHDLPHGLYLVGVRPEVASSSFTHLQSSVDDLVVRLRRRLDQAEQG